jgi:hypothetical protein
VTFNQPVGQGVTCITAGLWLVHGHTIERLGTLGGRGWEVATSGGNVLGMVRTVTDGIYLVEMESAEYLAVHTHQRKGR